MAAAGKRNRVQIRGAGVLADGFFLYGRYVRTSLKAQMQYRASFLMLTMGTFITTAAEFLGIWALFDRFSQLQGWSLPEVALLYGMAHISFSLSEALGRGFDVFPGMVKNGDFDRVLLRPRNTALQIAAKEVDLLRLGRLTQGVLVVGWALWTVKVDWTFPHVLLLIVSVLSGACLFIGLFVLQATLSFWTIESLEIANTLTYGGVETAQFPLEIYHHWFRRFFTFIVPLACLNYFPSLTLLGRPVPDGFPSYFPWMAPGICLAFLLLALGVWQFGVRHYHSTGS